MMLESKLSRLLLLFSFLRRKRLNFVGLLRSNLLALISKKMKYITMQALKNVGAILRAGGADYDRVVKTTIMYDILTIILHL